MSRQGAQLQQGTYLSSHSRSSAQTLSRLNRTMAGGDVWVQWFTCCITQQPPPVRNQKTITKQFLERHVTVLQRRRRPPIDRSMIGLPMNFQHTAHIGSSDIALGTSHIVALQNHMQSKGGYETAVPVEESVSRHAQPLTVT